MNIALVLAGGHGVRMNQTTPKQYLNLNGVPILVHSLLAFQRCSAIELICVACAEEYLPSVQQMVQEYALTKVSRFACAGQTRRDTSQNALRAVSPLCKAEDIILIHDAVRPFVTERIILENIQVAKRYGAVYTVFPTQDTIVHSLDGNVLSDIPPRETLFLGQTPQSFQFHIIEKAHAVYQASEHPMAVTDDCSLVASLSLPVGLVQGSKMNIKITTPEDLEIATLYAQGFFSSR